MSEKDVKRSNNKSFDSIYSEFGWLTKQMPENDEQKVLLFVYYIGYAEVRNKQLNAIFDEFDPLDRPLPLHQMLCSLSGSYKNLSIIANFDGAVKGNEKFLIPLKTQKTLQKGEHDIYITQMNRAEKEFSEKPVMAKNYIECMKQHAKENNNCIDVPSCQDYLKNFLGGQIRNIRHVSTGFKLRLAGNIPTPRSVYSDSVSAYSDSQ